MNDPSAPEIIELGSTDELLNISIPPASPAPSPRSAAVSPAPPPSITRPASPATSKPAVNFGPGIELLMNDKRKGDKSPSRSSLETLLDEVRARTAALCHSHHQWRRRRRYRRNATGHG